MKREPDPQEPVASTPSPTPSKPPVKRRPGPFRRFAVALIEGLGALLGLLVLGIALIGVRIAAAPLEVDWLTPAFTASLAKIVDPLNVTVAGTLIRWHGLRATLDVEAKNLRLTDADGHDVLALPHLAVSLDIHRLLIGQIAPTQITVSDAQLRLVRNQDGSIGIVKADAPLVPAVATPPDNMPVQPLLQSIRAAFEDRDPRSNFAHLRQIAVGFSEIDLEDLKSGKIWRADHGTLKLRRVAKGIDAQSTVTLNLSTPTRIAAEAHLDHDARTVVASATWDELTPADLQELLPPLTDIQLPVSGLVGGVFDLATLQPISVNTTLHLKAGTITNAAFAAGRLSIVSGEVAASYNLVKGQLDLSNLALDLGGPALQLTATAIALPLDVILGGTTGAPAGHPAAINASAMVRDLPLARFPEFWPPAVGAGAFDWITHNLTVGGVDRLNAKATITYDPAAKTGVVNKADGTMGLSNVTINYLPGLAKITGANLTATMSESQLAFAVQTAKLQGLTMSNGMIVLDQFAAPFQRLTIDAGMQGPISDVMTVLNAPRLGYATKMGIDPKQLQGAIDGTIHFQFPLKKDLPFDEVDYGAKARLSNLSMPNVALDHDLTEANVDLTLDPRKIVLAGPGKLGGIPLTINWMQRLAGKDGPRSEVTAKTRLDDAGRQTLGVDPVPDLLHGPADVTADYVIVDDSHANAKIAMDLTDSDLTVDWAGWEKMPGKPGNASFDLTLVDGAVTRVSDLHVTASDLQMTGNLELAGKLLRHADIDHLVQGETDIHGVVDHLDADSLWQINLRGPVLDVTEILKQAKDPDAGNAADPGPKLDLDIVTDRLVLGENRAIGKAVFRGIDTDRTMQSGTLTGSVGKAGTVDVRLDPVTSGGYFKVHTTDFGAFFHALGVTDDLVGGSFTVTGTSKTEGDARRFIGRAEGADFSVLHAPFLTRLLSLASFQSVGSLLTGQGIPFTTLKSDLSFRHGRLDIAHGRAFGGAIGLNADGWFDLSAGTLSLEGTLVPAYMLNSLIGNLPVIGNLLVGGEGEGLFDVNFRLGGKTSEPSVSVNPLSTFAPGFIRDLFLFDAPTPGGEVAPTEKAPPGGAK